MDETPQILLSGLPEPRPSIIELEGDAYIASPAARGGMANHAAIEKMFAMTPTQRLHWSECWKQAVRRWLRQGYTPEMIAFMVWEEMAT